MKWDCACSERAEKTLEQCMDEPVACLAAYEDEVRETKDPEHDAEILLFDCVEDPLEDFRSID